MSEHVFSSHKPSSGALDVLYVVPIAFRATVRVICTNTSETCAITVAVSPEGSPYNAKHEVLSSAALTAGEAITTAPLMLRANDVIRVLSTSGEVNFHVTGLLQDA